MDTLHALIEKGEELKTNIPKRSNKAISQALFDEASIWKTQCMLYIENLKISKTVKMSFNGAALNFIHSGYCSSTYLDDMLNTLKALLRQEENNDSSPKKATITHKSNKVFIVHGHDELLKTKVENVLLKLGLESIVLSEQPNEGGTIIDKFERNSSKADYAIILMTADDRGKKKDETRYKYRARQNVIFELGYFVAKLGKKNICYLYEKDVEIPSDIKGIAYVSVERDNWPLDLVNELKARDFNVSADKLLK